MKYIRRKIVKDALKNKKISSEHIELSIYSFKKDLDSTHNKYNKLKDYLNNILIYTLSFEIVFSIVDLLVFGIWSEHKNLGFILYVVLIGLIGFNSFSCLLKIFSKKLDSKSGNDGFLLGTICVFLPLVFLINKEFENGYYLDVDTMADVNLLAVVISLIILVILYIIKVTIIDIFVSICFIIKIRFSKNKMKIRNQIISYGVKEKMLGENDNTIISLESRDNNIKEDLINKLQMIFVSLISATIILCFLLEFLQSKLAQINNFRN